MFYSHSLIDKQNEHRITTCEVYCSVVEINPPPYSLDLMAATGFQIYHAMSRNFWVAHPISSMLSSRELRGTQILYKTLVPPVL